MKKKTIIGILIGVFLFFLAPNISYIIESIKLRFEKTPARFENYKLLRELALDDNFDIQIIETASIDFGQINDQNLIWLVKREGFKRSGDPGTTVYYKIDSKGIIIDSLQFTNEYMSEVDNYLVNIDKSYYSTWLKDGDTIKKSIVSIENKALINITEVIKYLKDAKHSVYTYENNKETNRRYKKIIFLKDTVWSEVFTESEDYISGNDIGLYDDDMLPFLGLYEEFDIAYYKKEILNGHTFPDFGLYLNGKTPENWRGTSYYDIKDKTKKLSFKETYARMYKGDDKPRSDLSVYKSPNKKFMIINNGGYGNTDYTLYLVRL